MDLPLGTAYFNQLSNKEFFIQSDLGKMLQGKMSRCFLCSVVVVVFSILFSLPKQTFRSHREWIRTQKAEFSGSLSVLS